MPLLGSRKSMETTDVVVDGDTYTLVTQISGYERDKINEASLLLTIPRGEAVKDDPDSQMIGRPQGSRRNFLLKQYFIIAWSHGNIVKDSMLKDMPAHHDDAVLEAIDKIMENQNGASEDSPLEERSTPSSIKTSPEEKSST